MKLLLHPAARWAGMSILMVAACAARAAPDDGADAAPAAPKSGALPGIVLQRDVYLPVDPTGHPASNEYIVVERRAIPSKDAEAGDASGSPASDDVPTRFILLPQEGAGAQDDDDSGASGSTPR